MKTSCGRNPGCCSEQLDDARKKRFLLIDVARIGDGELDQHQIIRAFDARGKLLL